MTHQNYTKSYQKYLSEDAMFGPVPISYMSYVSALAFISLFILWVWFITLAAFIFFWQLKKKNYTAKEFTRLITRRCFGLCKAQVRHLNHD